jgi:uncharacterized protein YbaA (DUF1428 family)
MYIQGFLVPVPEDKQGPYLDAARWMAPISGEYGALRTVECWADDVPRGKRTDLYRAVAAEPGETVAYSWILWPDRDTWARATETMMQDERFKEMPADMPFDGKRMVFGGFELLFETGEAGAFGYVDGSVAAVPIANRDAYLDHCRALHPLFLREGALRVVDGWGSDVPDGKHTDFRRAVEATADETVAFGWIEWPDKDTRDAAWGRLMADEAMQAVPMPFDGSRMIFGAFRPILDA